MDTTTKAITLTANDYKENDKLISLYSLEYGKITVCARGIKKATAKLKFAQEPFCFGQFELAETHEKYTLKTCQQIESFFSLREDIVAFYAGCSVLECISNLERENQPNPQLFVGTLRALQCLSCGVNPLLVVVCFIVKYLDLSGYKFNLNSCNVCGNKPDKTFLDLQLGGVVCQDCRTANSIAVSKVATTVLGLTEEIEWDKLKNVNASDSQLKDCLHLLSTYVSHSLGKIKSLGELIKIA